MSEGLSEETRRLFRLPPQTAEAGMVALIDSLGESISGMSEVDVMGVEPNSDLSLPRGWSGVVV